MPTIAAEQVRDAHVDSEGDQEVGLVLLAGQSGRGQGCPRGPVAVLTCATLLLAAAACWHLTASGGAILKGDGVVGFSAKATASKPDLAEATSCTLPHFYDAPSLFCWAVMYDSDEALLTSQLTGHVGMFACNDYLVISKKSMSLGKDECGNDVKTWQTALPDVSKGTYGVNAMTSSWLNVPVFLMCWDVVIQSGKVWEQNFTVKVDPDAVFFPNRLRGFLMPHNGEAMYTTDCRFWGGDQVGNLFGAIEVLSKQAVGAYKNGLDTCKNLPWQGWGEDYWMQHCMQALNIQQVGMFDQVSDGTCPLGGYAPCSDQGKIVLHPYKDAGQWWDCWKQSSPPPAPAPAPAPALPQ